MAGVKRQHEPTGVNPKNVGTPFVIRQSEFDSPIYSAWTEESGVESIRSIGGHQDLDVPPRIETVQLIDKLQHRPLHLVVPARPVVESGATDSVHLVEEDDARLLLSRHLEQLSHHPRTFAHVLLNELGTDDTDKGGVCPVCDCTCTEGLSGPWRTIQEDAFGGIDTELDEFFGLSTFISTFKPKKGRASVRTFNNGVSTTSRSFSICSLQPPTSE